MALDNYVSQSLSFQMDQISIGNSSEVNSYKGFTNIIFSGKSTSSFYKKKFFFINRQRNHLPGVYNLQVYAPPHPILHVIPC